MILLFVCEGGLLLMLWVGFECFLCVMLVGDVLVMGMVCKGLVSLKFGFVCDDFGYLIDLGLLLLSSL